MDQFEAIWAYREDTVYPGLFGGVGKGIFPLGAELFTQTFGQPTYDPRWLFHGVFEYPPHKTRQSWLYVSSGMSNPWDDNPDDYATQSFSGLGVEFVMETPAQADWAIPMLQRMIAYNLLLACGRFGDRPTFDYGHRISIGGSVTLGRESSLRNLMIVQPDHYPAIFKLPSGQVEMLHFIGITDDELSFAKATSSDKLEALLKSKGVYPLTDPDRSSIT